MPLPPGTRQKTVASAQRDNDSNDLPQRLLSSLKTTLLHQAEELRVGPSITLLSQRRSGVDLSLGPGVRLPTRLVGYHDLWTHHSMPDMLLNASRKMSPVDNVTASVESLFRGSRHTDFTEAVTWTRTVSRRWDGFVAYGTPDSSDDSAAHSSAYRAVALGADVWPLRRLPIRLEGGISALPARLGVFFSVGFVPRHYPLTPPPLPIPSPAPVH